MSRPRRVLALSLSLILAGAGTLLARDGDVSNVTVHGRVFTGIPHDVLLNGSLAYVALDTGLHIYDTSVPGQPQELSHLHLPSPALDLAGFGSLLLVANEESGLQIVDVSDPASPSVVSTYPTSGTQGVAVAGSIAYLAEASEAPASVFGLRTVDIANPASPSQLGFAPLPNGAQAVAVSGSTAFVGLGSRLSMPDHGMSVVDVSNPASPGVVAHLPTDRPVNDLVIRGSVAYLATGVPLAGAFVTADVSLPSAPTLLTALPLADAAMGLSLLSDVAYVASRAGGLVALDVSDPADPAVLNALPTGRETWAAVALGNLVFLAERSSSGQAGFTTISAPGGPGSFQEMISAPYAEATGATATPGRAYLLRRDALHIYDSTDPGALAHLSEWAPPGADLTAIAVDGPLAAVCQGDTVRLLDVSNPFGPSERGAATVSSGTAVRPVLEGNVLYVVNGRGFDTFDVSNPSNPSPLGTYVTGGQGSGLAVAGSIAYLGAGSQLEVVDVSSPGFPVRVGLLSVGGQIYGVAVSSGLAVLTGLDEFAVTVDVTTPSSPALLGSLGGGTGFDVAIYGERALIAGGRDGLLVVDITAPTSLSLEGFLDTSGSAHALGSSGATVFLATLDAQHWVLGCDTCAQGCLIQADLQSPDPDVCEGETVSLDGSTSIGSGCPGGQLLYQWFEDGTPIPGANGPTYEVPGSHGPGGPQYWLEVSCAAEPSCMDVAWIDVYIEEDLAPVIAANSLRVSKTPFDHTLWWSIESGSGETNIHASLDASELPAGSPEGSPVVGVSPSTSFTSALETPFGAGVVFYRVFGRGNCSGGSLPN